MEDTFILLKPVIMPDISRILFKARRDIFPRFGFASEFRTLMLDRTQVAELYEGMPTPERELLVEHIAHREVVVIRVQGPHAVEFLAKARGSSANPLLCEKDSLRGLCAEQYPWMKGNWAGQRLHCENFLDIPQDENEVRRYRTILGPYFGNPSATAAQT